MKNKKTYQFKNCPVMPSTSIMNSGSGAWMCTCVSFVLQESPVKVQNVNGIFHINILL